MTHIIVAGLALLLLMAVGGFVHFRHWKSSLVRTLNAGSTLVPLPCGEVEYASAGEGRTLLISHGGGTGYDNIQLYEYLAREGFRLICPSKPGYLRTRVEVADTFEAQADMFAALLDHLGVSEKVGVIALSMGGPAALQFVLRHPDRVQCLVMQDAVSKDYHPTAEAKSSLLGRMFLSPVGREFMGYLMDVSAQLWPRSVFATYLAVETTYDRKRAAQISREVMTDEADVERFKRFSRQLVPMSLRAKGTDLELGLAAKLPRYPLEEIAVPALVTHSRVDHDVGFDHGTFVADSVSGAQLHPFDGCGHLFWFGPEGRAIEARVSDFLKRTLP